MNGLPRASASESTGLARASVGESRGRLGVLGGTFDPIHFGHLDAADAARNALGLDQILFIPAHDSPLRAGVPHAAGFHRFAMVALAINGCPGYQVSDLELIREGRSYTIDTLRELHTHGWPPSQIHFILGADAFADITRWRGYPDVLDAARFVVISRPGASLADAVPAELRGDPRVMPVEAHTPDVSSTMIRQRLIENKPIDDLVPAAVARHIVAHALYTTVPLAQR